MADSYPCPHCGEYLEVPPEMRQTPVRCASCQKVFTPGASNDVNDEVPVARRSRGKDDFAEPPKRGSRKAVWIVLSLLFLCGLGCCGGLGYLVYQVFNPKWTPFESAEEGFRTKFPEAVNESLQASGRAAGNEMAKTFTARRDLFQEDYVVQCITLSKADQKKSPEELLRELAESLTSENAGSTLERQHVRRTQNGFEALELSLKHDQGHLQARIVLAKGKAYIVYVEGPFEPDGSPWVRQFLDAFTPLEAKKK